MALPITARAATWTHAGRNSAAYGPLDFEIAAGEKVLLLGRSGAGKSTLLHAIAGVLPEESGQASGTLLIGDSPPDPRRGECGLVLQDPDSQVIFSRLGDDVAFGMENLGLPAALIESRIAPSLTAMGLDFPLDHPTAALSGGQKQRLALAGILAMSPQVIVLDEPTANIDPESAPEVRDAVLALQADTSATMIIVEHQVGLWIDDVDTVIVLGEDGVLTSGPPRRVFGDPELADSLRACGIWMPGDEGAEPAVADRPAGAELMSTHHLGVARPGTTHAAATLTELRIRSGSALGIIGPNGAGKSTAALTLAGLIPEFSGEVLASEELSRGAKNARPFRWPSKFLAPRIGMVFQEPDHQFITGSVAEELALGPRLAGWSPAEVEGRVAELLDVLGLASVSEAHPQGLSGGEKRRLSVAAMMAPRPQILIVDEPTFGQDALTWAGLVDLFSDVLDHGCAVVAISHDRAFLAAIGASILDLGQSAVLPQPGVRND